MPESRNTDVSIESAYAFLLRKEWNHVMDFLHAPGPAADGDPRLFHLTDLFLSEFFASLPPIHHELGSTRAEIAERILLFQAAGLIRLDDRRFRDIVLRLVRHFEDSPARAFDVARFLPEEAECQAVIRRFAPPEKRSAPSAKAETIHVTEQARTRRSDVVRPLFRSRQEELFNEAVREAFPDYLPQPNVALHAFLAPDALAASLTARERDFLFRALVDCVIFDPRDGYRPILCFELDGPNHDDDMQMERDEMKDRILALAGLRLVRIRSERWPIDIDEFRAVLDGIALI